MTQDRPIPSRLLSQWRWGQVDELGHTCQPLSVQLVFLLWVWVVGYAEM